MTEEKKPTEDASKQTQDKKQAPELSEKELETVAGGIRWHKNGSAD
jgi:bacteriocin-like protein